MERKKPTMLKANAAGILMAHFYSMGRSVQSEIQTQLRRVSGTGRIRRSAAVMKPYGTRTKGYNEIHGNGHRIGYTP